MSKYSICKCQCPTFFIYGTTLICSKCREIKLYLNYDDVYENEDNLQTTEVKL